MPAWSWFVVALLLGGTLLAIAALTDRRSRRRLTGAGEPAPRRGIDDVDRHVPRYVTQDEIDAMPSPASGQAAGPLPHAGEGFGFGHAHPDFATRASGADWAEPADPRRSTARSSSMRELMAPLALATAEHPLVVVAAGIHPEVLTTLAANRRALGLPLVAAVAGARSAAGWPNSSASRPGHGGRSAVGLPARAELRARRRLVQHTQALLGGARLNLKLGQ